ncbi:MAG: hypothetical protein ACREBR_01255 [bacterium]
MQKIKLNNIHFPEFTKTRVITEFEAYVLDNTNSNKLRYDLILGRPFQRTLGFNVMNASDTIEWHGITIPFHPKGWWKNRNNVADLLETSSVRVKALEEEIFVDPTNMPDYESFITDIKPASYTEQDIKAVVAHQSHLTDNQQDKLRHLLLQFPALFNGKLGHYKKHKLHLDLKPGAVPYHAKPYSVPKVHEQVFKGEIDRLIELKVLEP